MSPVRFVFRLIVVCSALDDAPPKITAGHTRRSATYTSLAHLAHPLPPTFRPPPPLPGFQILHLVVRGEMKFHGESTLGMGPTAAGRMVCTLVILQGAKFGSRKNSRGGNCFSHVKQASARNTHSFL